METQLILLLGAALLACGSAGLLIVRLTNPRLGGLGWLGAAFASGGIGAVLLLTSDRTPVFVGTLLADGFLLLAFVLIHMAVLELEERSSMFPGLGIALLTIQVATDLALIAGYGAPRLRIEVAGVLIAAQVGQTAIRLAQLDRRANRPAVWFTAGILFCFMVFNLIRSLLVAFGGTRGRVFVRNTTDLVYAVYIVVALGVAFGFFWMTTAILSHDLELMASTDPLTRVYNRRYFLQWCEKERARTQRTRTGFAILMVDIDYFKRINDAFGHAAGDSVICAVVERMQDAVRGIDVIGRWGGEEFVVLLPGASAVSAVMVAQRVRKNVEKISLSETLSADPRNIQFQGVTVSIGVAGYQGTEDEIPNILERADRALYEAKTYGRNRVAETA
jgi:diguanylate cyclase (GGDEF)-like protein